MYRGVVLVLVVAACDGDVTGPLQGQWNRGECAADPDCAPAAVACCACPAFAVPVSDPIHRACAGVRCRDRDRCPQNIRAICDDGWCALACVAIECRQSCANGFAADDNGCLTCECAELDAGGCTTAADCVQVRADCCGCGRGGEDTAVLRRQAAAYDADLRCSPGALCPAATTCDTAAAPQCIQGRCQLTTSALPSSACGRSDLATCARGQVCIVNGMDRTANEEGVGVCVAGDGEPTCRGTPGGRNAL